jgi:RNA polymerase sigma factor (sigma-70 family)
MSPPDPDSLVSDLQEGRRRFLALVADVRPELHRYCARMTGSVSDGEDVVQETLARAYYALSEVEVLPPLRPWLFQIAHHRAIDHLRRYDRRMGEALDTVAEKTAADALDAEDALAREEAVHAAVSRFVELAPAQRSAVILKDVLDHSLEEIAALLELSVPAVKAALHRGRTRLRELSREPLAETAPRPSSAAIARYAALFNARDWEGVRAMLADDVRLDLVSRAQRAGRRDVASYFTNYAAVRDWRLAPGWLDGREVLAVFRDPRSTHPDYFVEVTLVDGRIVAIRDFRYVPYIALEAAIDLSAAG